MLFGFALRSAAAAGLMIAFSSGAFSAAIVPEAGNCNVNATAWKELNDKTSTSSTSPVSLPHTVTSFTTSAPGCIVVQVTGYATGNVDDAALLYFFLDGEGVTNQTFGRRGTTRELVTTTQILQNVSAGSHRLSLRMSSSFGHQVTVTPLTIAVHHRK
jgi:hypothetical protein